MDETFKSDGAVREYLLGRVSDEATLEGLEELLFTDEEFCSRVALAEDGLVNDYVLGRLGERDAASFRATLAVNPDRRFKVELTRALRERALARDAEESAREPAAAKAAAKAAGGPTFFDSLKAFFARPRHAAALAVLLVAALAALVYFGRRGGDELAELRALYRDGRTTETRVSEFGYAPLAQTRGEPEPRERGRLRRIENDLLAAAEERPGARTRHALGVFYLTQRRHAEAVRELEAAAKLDGRDARLRNDLGAARFELAKSAPRERRLEELARALEEFTAATELNPSLLEALFNRSLALQELRMPRQARESWALYLQRDSSSKWADEARANLARLDEGGALFRTDGQVLGDFLAASRAGDEARALRIHDETKGLLTTAAVPLQLSRRYLEARLRDDEAEAAESLAALGRVGDLERERRSEFFFMSWPATTPPPAPTSWRRCCAPRTPSPRRTG
ncbi:MAG TPA: hypothetical protein VF668_02370 [Pyrinomonadaceae bacterium]|jgi:tetratricopeptide (TPR) repeat protein